MEGLKQEYKDFWMDMFIKEISYEEVSNAFEKLHGQSLETELEHLAAQEDSAGYWAYYEAYVQRAATDIGADTIKYDFDFGAFYLPYLADIRKELLHWSVLKDKRLNGKMLMESAMQSGIFVMIPISTKVLVQEIHRLKNDGRLGTGTEEERYRVFQRLLLEDAAYRRELYSFYPRMFELLHIRIKQYKCFYKKLITDILEVWEEIGIGSVLEKITTGQGDTHNQGKSVAELTFQNGKKMLYKPRSLESEKAFMDLIKIYNSWTEAEQELKTYRVISKEDYGIAEFVPHDVVADSAAGKRYYVRCGELLALLYSLNATDMHYENLIASGEYPVIIDCETVITPFPARGSEELELLHKTESLKATCLLPVYVGKEENRAAVGGIGTGEVQKAPFKSYRLSHKKRSDIELIYDYQKLEDKKNNTGIPITGENIANITQGFVYGYRQILAHKEEYLACVKQLFERIQIRVVLRDTAAYATMLGILYHPDLLMDSVSGKVVLCKDYLEQTNKLKHEIYIMENNELLRGDIPYFYTYANQKDLYCGKDKQSDYYRIAPADQVQYKIEHMSEKDLDFQKTILEKTFLGQKAEYEKDMTGFCFGKGNKVQNTKTEYLNLAKKILDILVEKSFSFGKENMSWMDSMYDDESSRNIKYSYVGNDLYNGETGIGLVFLYYGMASGDDYYTEIAERIADYENRLMDTYDKEHPYLLGAFSGLSGRLYLNSRLYLHTRKKSYWDSCIRMMQFMDHILPKDRMLDVISGSAGYLHVLCSIYENESDSMRKEQILYYMERTSAFLVSRFDMQESGWKLSIEGEEKIYTGFGHGDSGIIAALARYDCNMRNRKHKELIDRVIKKHRLLFSEDHNGWYKNKDKKVIGYGWCHGSMGILMSRLLLKKYGYPDVEHDINLALKISSEKSFGGNMTLCHGDLSGLEIMAMAGSVLERESILTKETEGFDWLFEHVLQNGYCENCFRGTEVLGVMVGLAGYAYALVKQSCEKTPSILWLE